MSPVPCPRCVAAGPRGPHMGSDRRCAFPGSGAFEPDNWACATMDPIRRAIEDEREWDEDGEGSEWIWRRHSNRIGGWVVLSGYKDRGRTWSAIVLDTRVGGVRPFTLADVEALIVELGMGG